MFSTFKQRLLLGVYVFILLSIPIGAYLSTQTQIFKSKASEGTTNTIPKVATNSAKLSPARTLLLDSENSVASSPTPSASTQTTDTTQSPTIATSFGPTLSLKITLEGRQINNQSTKLFIGIVEGALSANPKFLLSFSVDVPASGVYSNLSLAGLTAGTQYTALIKGAAQIATSSTFTMSPNITNLNDGQPLNMLTGDLNEDNVINSSDFDIAQKALGANAQSQNWNESADFNKDGVVNTIDLTIIKRNIGQVGASGVWSSPIPQNATPSASLNNPSTGGPMQDKGYWLWLPK